MELFIKMEQKFVFGDCKVTNLKFINGWTMKICRSLKIQEILQRLQVQSMNPKRKANFFGFPDLQVQANPQQLNF